MNRARDYLPRTVETLLSGQGHEVVGQHAEVVLLAKRPAPSCRAVACAVSRHS